MESNAHAATITVDLKAAGLTHAKGASDRCDGSHDIDMSAVTSFSESGLAEPGDFDDILQALHEQAHPDGVTWWQSCRERGCTEAAEISGM